MNHAERQVGPKMCAQGRMRTDCSGIKSSSVDVVMVKSRVFDCVIPSFMATRVKLDTAGDGMCGGAASACPKATANGSRQIEQSSVASRSMSFMPWMRNASLDLYGGVVSIDSLILEAQIEQCRGAILALESLTVGYC